MSAFKGLYIKDLKLSMATFFIGIFLLNLLTVASLGLKEYFNEPSIPAVLFFIAIVAHVLYLPGMLLSSLQVEGQSQLWLHSPSSGWKLFLSKLLAVMTYFMISILLTILLAKLAVNGIVGSGDFEGFSDMVKENLFIMGGGITATSVYLSVWVLFYWALYHSLKVIPMINKIRWLVLLLVWILLTAIGDFILNTPVVDVIRKKGVVNINVFDAKFGNNTVTAEMAKIDIASIIMYLLVTIVVFLTAVWLLERKVEV
jgi:hypothetical protein